MESPRPEEKVFNGYHNLTGHSLNMPEWTHCYCQCQETPTCWSTSLSSLHFPCLVCWPHRRTTIELIHEVRSISARVSSEKGTFCVYDFSLDQSSLVFMLILSCYLFRGAASWAFTWSTCPFLCPDLNCGFCDTTEYSYSKHTFQVTSPRQVSAHAVPVRWKATITLPDTLLCTLFHCYHMLLSTGTFTHFDARLVPKASFSMVPSVMFSSHISSLNIQTHTE